MRLRIKKGTVMSFSRIFPRMPIRSQSPELMDRDDVNEKELFRTLDQFKNVNRYFSGIHGVLTKVFLKYMKENPRSEAYTVLDLGAGGCDIPIWLIKKCRKLRQPVKVVGVDHDQRTVSYVKPRVYDFPELSVVHSTARKALGEKRYDFIISNHFLHHLSDKELPQLICEIHSGSRIGYILNDLCRKRSAVLQFSLIAPLIFRDSFTVRDGLKSIYRGFTRSEIRSLAESLNPRPVIKTVFPAHICLYQLKS